MSTGVAEHYAAGGPFERVRAAIDRLAPDGSSISAEQLDGFDDFHTAGRMATIKMADLLDPRPGDVVLDAGAGLGGPARYLADRFGCRVIGLDLTPEFVAIANLLSERTGTADRVDMRVGDITATDLPDGAVDHCWTQHVAMNIADHKGLYQEIRRVLRSGGRFALFDVIDGGAGELILPVPWATKPEHSHLVTRDQLRALLEDCGFRIDTWDDPTDEMVEILRGMLAAPRPPAGTEPPLLHPSLFIDDLAAKAASYFANMEEGRTALVLAVCTAI